VFEGAHYRNDQEEGLVLDCATGRATQQFRNLVMFVTFDLVEEKDHAATWREFPNGRCERYALYGT